MSDLSQGSEHHVVERKNAHVEGKTQNDSDLSRGSDTPTKIRISGHRLRWIWRAKGSTSRKPDRTVRMKGWTKFIYRWGEGATIVLNPRTMEIWMRSKPYKNPTRMIYANWGKADRIAREWSAWAQVPIEPIKTDHPADLDKAHMVIETDKLNPILKPEVGKPTSARVGLVFDKSHKDRPELTGRESAEGAIGLDWLLLDFAKEFRQSQLWMREYNENIKLHLEVLREIRDAMRRLER